MAGHKTVQGRDVPFLPRKGVPINGKQNQYFYAKGSAEVWGGFYKWLKGWGKKKGGG